MDDTNIRDFDQNPEVAKVLEKLKKKKRSNFKFCKICDKDVARGENESTHKQKYHNEIDGNLTCPKCEKTFPNFPAVYNHIKNNHEKNPCPICGAMYGKNAMSR